MRWIKYLKNSISLSKKAFQTNLVSNKLKKWTKFLLYLVTVPNSEEMVFVRVLEKFEDNQSHFIRPHIKVVLEQHNIYFLPFSGIR